MIRVKVTRRSIGNWLAMYQTRESKTEKWHTIEQANGHTFQQALDRLISVKIIVACSHA